MSKNNVENQVKRNFPTSKVVTWVSVGMVAGIILVSILLLFS
ncbi:hypothetical protein [Robertmurraya korlensis]|nr:hypothetical protein [Robertmurraya korlensis]